MLIAAAGGGARADMVLVVGDARGYVGSRAFSIHRLGTDHSATRQPRCAKPPREWARGVRREAWRSSTTTSPSPRSPPARGGQAPWCGISIELDPRSRPPNPARRDRRSCSCAARTALARRGEADEHRVGGRPHRGHRRARVAGAADAAHGAESLRTVSAPLVLHGMMSPQLRDAVVQRDETDRHGRSPSPSTARRRAMAPSSEVAHPERLVIRRRRQPVPRAPRKRVLPRGGAAAACMRREAGEDCTPPNQPGARSMCAAASAQRRSRPTAHTCSGISALFEAAGRLDRADAARAIDCVMEIESYFRAANAPIFTCVLGVDGNNGDKPRFSRAGWGWPRSSRSGGCRSCRNYRRVSRATDEAARTVAGRRWKSSRTCGGSSRCPIGNRASRPAARRRVLSERVVSGRRHAGTDSVFVLGERDRDPCFPGLAPCPSIYWRRRSTSRTSISSSSVRPSPICCCCGTSCGWTRPKTGARRNSRGPAGVQGPEIGATCPARCFDLRRETAGRPGVEAGGGPAQTFIARARSAP